MRRRKRLRRIRIVFFVITVVCLFRMGQTYYQLLQHEKRQEILRESLLKEEAPVSTPFDVPLISETLVNKISSVPVMLNRFRALYEENNDLVGWLYIDGTNINYPVVKCNDGEYYLHHDFYGNDDRYGCLFVKDIADVNTPGTNFIIYGHNMKDGAMFGDLDLYQKIDYYNEHPVISFDTLYEERNYEIIAVFKSKVYAANDDVFKYYQFYEADTQEEFDYFYENIKEMSIYDTGVSAEFGDTFLTLSTCAYHTDNGRFVVVAKKKK